MFTVTNAALKLGWPIGTHAIWDRAVRTLLDVYERVFHKPNLPPGTLAMEHAFLADQTQRARAIKFAVAVTLQHALLYALGESLLKRWGPERTRHLVPAESWLDEGAHVRPARTTQSVFDDPTKTI